MILRIISLSYIEFETNIFYSGGSSPQYSVSTHSQAQYTGTYSPPPPEPVDFSGLPRPIGVEYLGSLGSSSYSRESTPSTGSSHFMEGYKDFNGTATF